VGAGTTASCHGSDASWRALLRVKRRLRREWWVGEVVVEWLGGEKTRLKGFGSSSI
jgi:hypothetical protein